MQRGLIAAAVLGAAAFAGTTVNAAELLFTYTDSSGVDVSFEQSSNPTPILYALGVGADVAVTEISSNVGSFSDVAWYSTGYGGMFTLDYLSPQYSVEGPQVYTGPASDPVFTAGKTYTAFDSCDGLKGTLTITNVSAAPEPSTWALVIESIGAIGLVLRHVRRRRDAAELTPGRPA
jgi:hypothetical protein